jgi:hypothetical protein
MNNHLEGMSLVLNLKDLAAERAWYLYKYIREQMSDDSKDITCPKHTVPKPKSLEIVIHGRSKNED